MRGKIVSVPAWVKQRAPQFLAHPFKSGLIQRASLADEAFRVNQTDLRQDDGRLPALDLPDGREIPALPPLAGQRNAEENMGVESLNDQHRAVVVAARAVLLETDVDAEGAPPNLPLMVKQRGCPLVDLSLLNIPAVEILFH